jgi:serine/threonine protein kinase
MNIMVRDWQALNRLLDAALSLPAVERASWLESLNSEHDALKPVLRELLSRPDLAETGNFLNSLPKITGGQPKPEAAAAPGDLIGPYRLVRMLGAGGMGSVWLAERNDDLLKRTVALKMPHLAGELTGLAERMARERNILAALEHPNIARLYDAGLASDGRPYLALEYIEGLPVERYCTEHQSSIRERLGLAMQVARAMAYAHAHLVVHRDLKPSNILVGGDGQVHLLDFGIATLLSNQIAEQKLLADTSLTRQVGAALTPDYASPEHIRGEPVSTTSDVYSLGVILYELLAGRRPYEFKGTDLLSLSQTIHSVEPCAPSEATADRTVRRALRGDLDTIVLKALRKAPAERYATVAELADDIERYLHGEPVLAQPDRVAYRVVKFVQRNRVAAIAAVLVAVSLCGGMVATMWQAQRAVVQRRIAQAAQARAERRFHEVRQLAHSILFDYHDAIKDLPGATPVRARLVHDALDYFDRLAKEARDDTMLQRELATAYERVGNIQGGTMFANLGDTRGALESEHKALSLREQIVAADPHNVAARRELALSERTVGILEWETGNIQQALQHVEGALTTLQAIAAESSSSVESRLELAKTYDYLGRILQEQGEPANAQKEYATSVGILEKLRLAEPDNTQILRALSVVREQAGSALTVTGDLAGALAHHREALKLRERLAAASPLNADYKRTVLVSWYNIGEVLSMLGDTRQALDSYRRDLEIAEGLLAADPKNEEYRGDVAYASIRVGDMLAALGRPVGALGNYRRSLAMREADVRSDPTNLWKRSSLIEAHAKISGVLVAGDPPAALAEANRTLALMEATDVDPQNAVIRSFFAETYANLGDVHAALAAGGADSGTRWRVAREMLRRAEVIWRALDERGALSSNDVKRRKAAAVSSARTEKHLRNVAAVNANHTSP